MNLSDDTALAGLLRDDVRRLHLHGPGPDLHAIRRAGTRRRRLRQAAAGTGTAVFVLAAGGAVATALDRSDELRPGYATGPAGAPKAADPAAVTAVIDGVLTRAGVAHPAVQAGANVDAPTGATFGWSKRWQITGTDPKLAVSVSVYPDGQPGPAELPCAGDPATVRGCTDQTLDGGVRILAGESSGHAIVGDNGQRSSMWSPMAVALYPDGRQVVMIVGLLRQQGDPEPEGSVLYDYSGAITLDELRAAVADPGLARISNP